MRNGSSGHDGRGWQATQDPYQGQSGPLPELPYGPDVSWPSGFRRTEFDSGEYRQLVDDYQGHNGRAHRPANRYQPASEDRGYGDPGYADPRYDGPRDRFATGPMPAVDHIYPVTGAQEILRDSYPPPPSKNDPRVAGLRYDELRYDEPGYGQPHRDERLSDEAWYAELRRGEPAFPPAPPAVRSAPHAVPPGPGQDRRPARGGAPAGYRPDGGQRGHVAAPAARPREDRGPRPTPAPAAAPAGFLAAPVGVLAPSARPRVDTARVQTARVETARVEAGRLPAGRVQERRVETVETYWQQDDQAGYSALLRDLEVESIPEAQPAPARRSAGRRRGRSSDHRLWIGLVGVVAVAGGAIFGILKVTSPGNTGPAHTLAMTQRIGIFTNDPAEGKRLGIGSFTQHFAGLAHTTDNVSAAYSTGKTMAGLASSVVMVFEGHLANDDPAASMHQFMKNNPDAVQVPPGPLGGDAGCAKSAQVEQCWWFDNDTIGAILSSTMAPSQLASALPSFRAAVETIPGAAN